MATKFGTIISGSRDKTAIVWNGKNPACILTGHTMDELCVHILPKGRGQVTYSEDMTVRIWRLGECSEVLSGHTDAVTGQSIISSSDFLTCSRDSTVCQWNANGESLGVYNSQKPIHSITLMPNSQGCSWITAGEDRLEVWEQSNVVPEGTIELNHHDATVGHFSHKTETSSPGKKMEKS